MARILSWVPIAVLAAGCAGPSAPTSSFRADAADATTLAITGLEYEVELDPSATRWRGEPSVAAPLRTKLEFAWRDAPGLRATLGEGDAAIRCAPGDLPFAAEGDGYAWSVAPRADGCSITLDLVTRHNAPRDLGWTIEGWDRLRGPIRASLTVTAHP